MIFKIEIPPKSQYCFESIQFVHIYISCDRISLFDTWVEWPKITAVFLVIFPVLSIKWVIFSTVQFYLINHCLSVKYKENKETIYVILLSKVNSGLDPAAFANNIR